MKCTHVIKETRRKCKRPVKLTAVQAQRLCWMHLSMRSPVDPPVDTPVDTPVDNPVDNAVDNPEDTPVDNPVDNPGPTAMDTDATSSQESEILHAVCESNLTDSVEAQGDDESDSTDASGDDESNSTDESGDYESNSTDASGDYESQETESFDLDSDTATPDSHASESTDATHELEAWEMDSAQQEDLISNFTESTESTEFSVGETEESDEETDEETDEESEEEPDEATLRGPHNLKWRAGGYMWGGYTPPAPPEDAADGNADENADGDTDENADGNAGVKNPRGGVGGVLTPPLMKVLTHVMDEPLSAPGLAPPGLPAKATSDERYVATLLNREGFTLVPRHTPMDRDEDGPGLYYIYRPYGSQQAPSFLLFDAQRSVRLDIKGSNGNTVMLNDGFFQPDTIYLLIYARRTQAVAGWGRELATVAERKAFLARRAALQALNRGEPTRTDNLTLYVRSANGYNCAHFTDELRGLYLDNLWEGLKPPPTPP